MLKIDKSKFSPEELALYQALIAKAVVPDAASASDGNAVLQTPAQNAAPDQNGNPAVDCQKSVPFPALDAALKRVEQLEKAIELKSLETFAKKYESLGERPEELATTLYALKKSDAASYDAYVKLLDKNLALAEQSGLFGEIGKSGRHGGPASVLERIQAAAAEIQKNEPGLNHTAAVAKAWEVNPELIEEYDAAYGAL